MMTEIRASESFEFIEMKTFQKEFYSPMAVQIYLKDELKQNSAAHNMPIYFLDHIEMKTF